MSIRRACVANALVASVALALTGCVGDPPGMQDVARDRTGAVIDGGEVGSQKVRVGDCFGPITGDQLDTVDVVPCTEPHVYEAFHQFDVDGDEHPGSDVIEDLAEQRCLGTFEGYVGLAYAQSIFAISYFWPTEDTWDNLDDRRVLCLLVPVDETPTAGTARASAR